MSVTSYSVRCVQGWWQANHVPERVVDCAQVPRCHAERLRAWLVGASRAALARACGRRRAPRSCAVARSLGTVCTAVCSEHATPTVMRTTFTCLQWGIEPEPALDLIQPILAWGYPTPAYTIFNGTAHVAVCVAARSAWHEH